jgi:hypothetical protein
MRKHVTPVHPDAKIWDPAHGRFLPSEGQEVEFDHHWERMLRQGNVTAADVAAPVAEPPKSAKPKPDAPAE